MDEEDVGSISAEKKRGGERRPRVGRQYPGHRVCPDCGKPCHAHLYVIQPDRIRACLVVGCTWLTCIFCAKTFDIDVEVSAKSVFDGRMPLEISGIADGGLLDQ